MSGEGEGDRVGALHPHPSSPASGRGGRTHGPNIPVGNSSRRAAPFPRHRLLELLDHTIARVERLDPRINAVVVRDFDRARQRARALDRQDNRSAPLFGVPMTIKESFNVAGLPTTWGAPAWRDSIAPTNALAVDRLLDAGAILFGKTNVPLMLADWQSYNAIYGTTNNPWNLALSPGGSSGGSAAALAAGLTGIEAGSDIGSSIRNPAHYCGVYGHKPTWGICPPLGQSLGRQRGASRHLGDRPAGALRRGPDTRARSHGRCRTDRSRLETRPAAAARHIVQRPARRGDDRASSCPKWTPRSPAS